MIFIVDENPQECVLPLADAHLAQQLKSTADILVEALKQQEITGPLLHGDPPLNAVLFVEWAMMDWDHFLWLVFYGMALAEEIHHRERCTPPAAATVYAAGNIAQALTEREFSFPEEWPWVEEALPYWHCDVFYVYQMLLKQHYQEGCSEGDVPTWTRCEPPEWLAETCVLPQ